MNADDAKGLFFLDTNILVYTFDDASPAKQAVARAWVRSALKTQRGLVSSQVVQEFLNVALKKFVRPMGVTDAREYLHAVLQPLCQHLAGLPSFDHALLLKEQTGYSWYDALILAAALETGCTWLITEDLEHGRKIGAVTICDPFR